MNFNDYQAKALTTNSYGTKGTEITDPAFLAQVLGLVGEAGEVAEKFKKVIRNKNGKLDEDDKKEIVKELGDTLWYVAVISHYLKVDLQEVVDANIAKLADRKNRNVIKSQGDNR